MKNTFRNNRLKYYSINLIRFIVPDTITRMLRLLLSKSRPLTESEEERVGYYLGKTEQWNTSNQQSAISIDEFKRTKKNSYYIDLMKYLRFFPSTLKISYEFGDVVKCKKHPTIVKSRPINKCHSSIILKLDTIRHFHFINDTSKFKDKKDMLVWRGGAYQEHRIRFLKKYCDHPLCDIGHVPKSFSTKFCDKPYLSIEEQLKYKFILSLEGNDTASNLKWLMSSSSACIMPKPKFETWFMEGKLIPNVHYIQIKDDYSDLIDKINYYINNQGKALEIIKNANNYTEQFKNKKTEDLISMAVLERYFSITGKTDKTQ